MAETVKFDWLTKNILSFAFYKLFDIFSGLTHLLQVMAL